MMKVLGINSSPRGNKSQTQRLVKAALDGAKSEGADVEFVDLCQLKIDYCNGCGVCFAKGKCVHGDDFEGLYKKVLESDGLVLGSPNYFRSVTAQMKTLIDRMADAVQCQLLSGKYGCTVATAGGVAFDEVIDYLNGIIVGFGANAVGGVGASPFMPGAMEQAEGKAFALGQDLVDAVRNGRIYPDQEKIHREMESRFKELVDRNREAWHHEYEYWTKKGGL